MKIHDVNDKLPKDYKRVLIFNKNINKWITGFIVRGITMKERKALPDSDERKSRFRFGDEHGNNTKPYKWEGEGAIDYFGQDITHWCKLPKKIK